MPTRPGSRGSSGTTRPVRVSCSRIARTRGTLPAAEPRPDGAALTRPFARRAAGEHPGGPMAGKHGGTMLRRREVSDHAVVDERALRRGMAHRARLGLRRALTRRNDRGEAKLDAALAAAPALTRSNT